MRQGAQGARLRDMTSPRHPHRRRSRSLRSGRRRAPSLSASSPRRPSTSRAAGRTRVAAARVDARARAHTHNANVHTHTHVASACASERARHFLSSARANEASVCPDRVTSSKSSPLPPPPASPPPASNRRNARSSCAVCASIAAVKRSKTSHMSASRSTPLVRILASRAFLPVKSPSLRAASQSSATSPPRGRAKKRPKEVRETFKR